MAAAVVCFALWMVGRSHVNGSSCAKPEAEATTTANAGIDRSTWWRVAASFLIVAGGIGIWLFQMPGYAFDTLTLNIRDPWSLHSRFYELMNGFYALPAPLTFGVLGVWTMAFRSRSRAERFLGMYALLLGLLMLLLPPRFYWRHLMIVMPVCCLGAVLWWQRFAAEYRPAAARRIAYGCALLVGLTHLAALCLYHLRESQTPPSWQAALEVLRDEPGPVFTLDPLWAVASGQPLYPWPYACDAVFARQYDLALPETFTFVLKQSPTALLNRKTWGLLPTETKRYLRQNYRTIFQQGTPMDKDYVEVLRRENRDAAPLLQD